MVEPIDPAVWRRTIRSRLLVVAALLGLWVLAIEARLAYFQVFQHEYLQKEAVGQQEDEVTLPARRGDIVDRHGRVLAYSVDEDSVYADPKLLASKQDTLDKLCRALDGCSAEETAKVRERFQKRSYNALVRRWVTHEQAGRVQALALKGVHLEKESRRYYPNRELASHVLGFVGKDQVGLSGLEERFEKLLRGQPGRLLVQHDVRGNAFRSAGTSAVPGATLELTIDSALQYIAERELQAGVTENRAAAGSVVIMDPTTGEILAMANWPTFNPNDYNTSDENARRNRAVQDSYEPGSTFKMITATAALEEKVMTPGTIIETGNGVWTLPTGRLIRDTHAHGTVPFHEAIAVSSNIGAVKTGLLLGAERLGKYVKDRFSFGRRLSPDFSGENAGLLYDPSTWKPWEALASVAMGYQISVTPLQMATAASAIANGGELLKPRVLRAVIDGNRRQVVRREVTRRVASAGTLSTLTGILEEVVESGTAKLTQIAGFTSAGKTGTSSKLVHDAAGHAYYSKEEYNASFVGFVPSRSPALTIIVWVDSPRAGKTYGGVVAGPVFQRIATQALRYLAVPPNVDPPAPLFVHRGAPNEIRVAGPAQSPRTILQKPAEADGELTVPELHGFGGREALSILARLGLGARLAGDGIVLEQEPPAGTPVEPGASCRLVLGRAVPREPLKAGGERP
jgi:cell division protein FtsI (penicillin-binding protein 3)